MIPDYLQESAALQPTLAALRAAFHAAPELGNQEFQTAARIEQTLRAIGVETERVTDTAVVATLRGGLPGPTVALRAASADGNESGVTRAIESAVQTTVLAGEGRRLPEDSRAAVSR